MLAFLALAACGGSSPPALPATSAAAAPLAPDESSYQVGAGDKVRVTVFRHPDLSGEFQLDGAGNFAMPLIGEVKGNGVTTRQLEARIVERLQDGYLIDPQVSVEVLNYRPFYILGEVKNPGSYPFVNGMTVLNAVALAGGYTYRADQDDILLKRGGSNAAGIPAAGDTHLLPGDVVEVQERFF
jgi:polysaccharide export outer membrane protein